MTNPDLRPPIPFDAAIETPAADEQEVHRALNETLAGIITTTHADSGHAERSVHAKSHALLQGELIVHDDLAPELRQGIFATPGRRYPALIRISSIAGDILRDQVSLPRGFAIKLIGVDGVRLPGTEGEVTQDFLFASGPASAAPDAKTFLKSLKLVAATTDRAEWAKAALSATLRPLQRALAAVGLSSELIKTLGGYPVTNPLGERYYTQAAIRFGDFIAKLDVVPQSDNFRRLQGVEIALNGRANALRDEVLGVLRGQGGEFSLRAQLRRDAGANPVEDASRVWPEAGNPYLPLARISVAAQTSWSAARSRVLDDETSFNAWHGIEAHRPLGNIMRARRAVYPPSAALRARLNGCPIHEPSELPRLD